MTLGQNDQDFHSDDRNEEQYGNLSKLGPVSHEIIVLLYCIDCQQPNYPQSAHTEEVSRRDVVDILHEEESEIVQLELNDARSTVMRRRTILRKGLRLAKALVSR